ncbi:MAG: trehalose-phosphatase [Solirubrobacterales bacterium]|nr:trehalose-phosphatase [Solirubrobacterales bacterium]
MADRATPHPAAGRRAPIRHPVGVTAQATLAQALAPLRAQPGDAAVLLDVDGTLAPIVRHADDALVPEPTRAQLIGVAKRYGLVACVSGREAAIARRIVSLGSIAYVGNHGAELLLPGGGGVELDPEVATWVPRVHAFARETWTGELDRLRVRREDKNVIAAYHWRGAPDEAAAEQAAKGLAEAAEAQGLAVHFGRKVLEVRPPVPLDKGRGVVRLLADRPIRAALYVGDDLTDLDAFAGLRRLVEEGSLDTAACVGVASDETPDGLLEGADAMVDGPLGVRALLQALLDT